jgi:cyclin B
VEEGDAGNAQSVAEYVPDIFNLLFDEELAYISQPQYMEKQKDINAKMRAILIDWLVEVHMKYQLRSETLFLTVNLIDRCLALMPVARKKLQLVGVAAMLIAAKFEEIDPPKVHDFVYITDSAYTKEDILVMECNMLNALGFKVVAPTPAHFLDRMQRANVCDGMHREVAQYLLELAFLEIQMIRYPPSHLVSAALLLSNKLLGHHPFWPRALAQLTHHSEATLRCCADEMWKLLKAAPDASLQAVRKKYMQQQHQSVARMTFTEA